MPQSSRKATQFLWAAIKILIVLLAGYFVYQKLLQADFWLLESHLDNTNRIFLYSYIAILILLSVVNWGLEIRKWRLLVSVVRPLSTKASSRQVFTAHLSGFITPAKAGDYGAKALAFPKEDRKKILFLNFLGNMYQLLATLFFGGIGLGIIAFFTSGTAIFFWLMGVMMCVLFYFIFPRFFNRIKWSLGGFSWAKVRSFLRTISLDVKKRARLLSFLRYVVFAHQFYFILWVLGSDLSYIFTMSCIGAMYLLSSLLPVMQLFDVVVRGGIAILIFGWFYVSEEIVLSAVLVMWLLNVMFPLLLGVYFLLVPARKLDQKKASTSSVSDKNRVA